MAGGTSAEGSSGDHEEGGHNLFELGLDLDLSKTLLCLMALIAFTILFETLVEAVEHMVEGRKDLKKAVQKIFRELTILGVISFLLFMIEQLSTDTVPTEWLLSFEFAHILLFFMALVYIGQCVHASISVMRAREAWFKMHHERSAPTRGTKRLGVGWMNLFGVVQGKCEFCLLRSLFISQHKLPQDFEFAEYVLRTLVMHLTNIIEISKITWGLILALIVVLEILTIVLQATNSQSNLRASDGEDGAALATVIGLTVGGWLVTIAAWLLLRHLQHVILQMLDRSFWFPMERTESVRWRGKDALVRRPTQEEPVDGIDDPNNPHSLAHVLHHKHVHFSDGEEAKHSPLISIDLAPIVEELDERPASVITDTAEAEATKPTQDHSILAPPNVELQANGTHGCCPHCSKHDDAEHKTAPKESAAPQSESQGLMEPENESQPSNSCTKEADDDVQVAATTTESNDDPEDPIDIKRRESFAKALSENLAENGIYSKPKTKHEDLQLQMYRVLAHKAQASESGSNGSHCNGNNPSNGHHHKHQPAASPAPARFSHHPDHHGRCKYCGASRDELRKKQRSARLFQSQESDAMLSETSAFKDLTVDRAFMFNSPKLLRRIIDFIFVATCFHVALVFVFQLYVSLEVIGTFAGILLFVVNLLAPAITVFVLNPLMFQKYTIVMAIAHVEPEILGDVLESMIEKTKGFRTDLIVRLRHELQQRGRQGLQMLFQEMDHNNDGIISVDDFRDALAMMGIFYSGSQFRTLLAIVNPAGHGLVIEYQDFVELIFPSRSHWSVDVKVQQPLQEFEMELESQNNAYSAAQTHHSAHVQCLEHLAVLQELADEHPTEMFAQAQEIEAIKLRVMQLFHEVTHEPTLPKSS